MLPKIRLPAGLRCPAAGLLSAEPGLSSDARMPGLSTRFRLQPLVIAALGLGSLQAQAGSLAQLYERLPPPPPDVSTALSGSQDGQIVTPEYRAFQHALAAERAQTLTLAGGSTPALTPVGALEEGEAPEVRQAAAAYDRYLAAHADKKEPSAALGKRTRWLQAAMGGSLGKVMARIRPCPEPCSDAATLAQNSAAAQDKARLAQQDLNQWRALFDDWTRDRGSLLVQAEAMIAATGEGAKAQTAAGRLAVAKYRVAMQREIEVALSVTELAVKRAWAIDTQQPDAISSSTRNAKAAK